jgi:polysaccharide pyruvyl transferase WcaK-like protein
VDRIKVLQLASFEGNIGDNANHAGSKYKFSSNLNVQMEFENHEIREYFWGERKFDKNFAKYVNEFDLLIIGGGNFFELWVDKSSNNTSIDIDIPILKSIETPILFYALGMDAGMGVTSAGISKFKTWLDYVIAQKRFLLSLRNDGSYDTASRYLGPEYMRHFHVVPDGGFFTKVIQHEHAEIPKAKRVIGVNIAGDMPDIRFPNNNPNDITYKSHLTALGLLFQKILYANEDIHLVFYPHIYKDLGIISELLYELGDKLSRNRITVAPYLHGDMAQDYIFDSYRHCDIIMGNRFHTNVCAIGLNVPTIGFVNYPQIQYLYHELNLEDRIVHVNILGFEDILEQMIYETMSNKKEIQERYKQVLLILHEKADLFHKIVEEWYNGLHADLN